jgi:hypothetical protein
MEEAVAHWNQVGKPPMTLRTPQQIARFFDGLDLLPPGVVSCSRWRPGPAPGDDQPAEVDQFCGSHASHEHPALPHPADHPRRHPPRASGTWSRSGCQNLDAAGGGGPCPAHGREAAPVAHLIFRAAGYDLYRVWILATSNSSGARSFLNRLTYLPSEPVCQAPVG